MKKIIKSKKNKMKKSVAIEEFIPLMPPIPPKRVNIFAVVLGTLVGTAIVHLTFYLLGKEFNLGNALAGWICSLIIAYFLLRLMGYNGKNS
jgi:multisubunit Na+/H+ antiporter MnhE subunit